MKRMAIEETLAEFAAATAKRAGLPERAGRALVEQAYGQDIGRVAAALGEEKKTDAEDKAVRLGQNLADDLTARAWRERARPKDNQDKEKLIRHMLGIRRSIEARVRENELRPDEGKAAYKRIRRLIFGRGTPKSSLEFARFEKEHNARLEREIGREVERRHSQGEIAAAVADKTIGEKLAKQDAGIRQAVMQGIRQELEDRNAKGKLPAIRLVDPKAPAKTMDAQRPAKAKEQNKERSR
ncbi:MAG: hypothetical protein LBS70_05445 [Candidatus Accumulibacter sp.]|jgi:hypothetical protein|nr:hypothetical protein [Accumulibacter sp.]